MSYATRGYSGRRKSRRKSALFLLLSIAIVAGAVVYFGVRNEAVQGSPLGRLLPGIVRPVVTSDHRSTPTPSALDGTVPEAPATSEAVPTANSTAAPKSANSGEPEATKVPKPPKEQVRPNRRPTPTATPPPKKPTAKSSPTPRRAIRPTPTAIARVYHTVVPGDSLYSISDRYTVRVNELAEVNGLNVRTEVYIDQRLLIPTQKAPIGLRLPAVRKNPKPPKMRALSALSPDLVAYMESRSGTFAGAIFEPRSGIMYVHHPQNSFVAASTMKVPIMLTLLSRENAQDSGSVGSREPLLVPMIVVSDNGAATTLFKKAGGQKAVQAEVRARGLTHTRVEPDQWGLSTTTAPDMARLMRSLYLGQRLNPALRRSALGLLGNVVEPQRWGVPEGVPDSTYIAFKGGWLEQDDGWQVHQIGVMETNGRTFVFALMTAGQPGEVYGRESLEGAGKLLGSLPSQP